MDKNEPWYVILNMDFRYEICRRCPKSGLFKGTYEECEKWIEQKKKCEKHVKRKNLNLFTMFRKAILRFSDH